MNRDVLDILSDMPTLEAYVPKVYTDIKDFEYLYKAENQLFKKATEVLKTVLTNNYIDTMDFETIIMYEEMLNIKAEPLDSLEIRKSRVKNKLALGNTYTDLLLLQRFKEVAKSFHSGLIDEYEGAFLKDYLTKTKTAEPYIQYTLQGSFEYQGKNEPSDKINLVSQLISEFLVEILPCNIMVENDVFILDRVYLVESALAQTGEVYWNYRVGSNAITSNDRAMLDNHKANYRADGKHLLDGKEFISKDSYMKKEVFNDMATLTDKGKQLISQVLFDSVSSVIINNDYAITELSKNLADMKISYKLPEGLARIESISFKDGKGNALTEVKCDLSVIGLTTMTHSFRANPVIKRDGEITSYRDLFGGDDIDE